MQANNPHRGPQHEGHETPSQKLRKVFRLPRRGTTRPANDNPVPMRQLVIRAVLIHLALIGVVAAVVLGLTVL